MSRFKARKHKVRARSRDMRCGLSCQRYDALWRYASVPRYKWRAERAKQLLSRPHVRMQVDPSAYFRSPARWWDWEDWQREDAQVHVEQT